MSLPKKIAAQICEYYQDLEKNKGRLGSEMSIGLQEDLIYARIMHGIAQREKARYSFRKNLKIACAALAILTLSITGYYQLRPGKTLEKQTDTRTAVAANGRVVQLTLTDGTVIWLNSGTRLMYPVAFDKENRVVSLEGEAYFQVAHNAEKPFLIHTGKLTTRVLGTSFNIKAYSEDKIIQVAVLTGRVGVSLHTSKGLTPDVISLTPNQRAIYDKNARSMRTERVGNLPGLISWRTGRLQYDDAPLSSVVADLERKYAVEISLSPDLEKRKVTVDFDNESITKVMIILSELTGTKIIKTQKGFLLR